MLTRSILVIALFARVASAETLALPWQLQPVTTSNVARADTAIAVFNDPNGNLDISGTTALSARYRLTEHWAPIIRLGVAGNNAPGAALDGSSFANPIAGATYTRMIDSGRLTVLAATTLPIGTGGGNDPDLRIARTNAASITARPVDAPMFEVNYLTGIVGADVAYTMRGVTVQAEAMLHQSIRVRGENTASATDALRTRAALGAHAATFLGRHVSLGADVLYQRWLAHPTEIDMTGAKLPIPDGDLASLTVSAGLRLHFNVLDASMHPGLAYTRGLDATERGPMMITNRTNAVTFDLPVLF